MFKSIPESGGQGAKARSSENFTRISEMYAGAAETTTRRMNGRSDAARDPSGSGCSASTLS